MNDQAVLQANEAFYQAFANRDLAAMENLWSRMSPIVCIHPGWAPLFGREVVMASWRSILDNPRSPALVCRQPRAFVQGDSAFVVCFEDLGQVFLIATNLFLREEDGWKLIHHQAGPMPTTEQEEEDDDDDDGEEDEATSERLH
jgi:ketosteroid isomerase-like protein